MTRDTVFSCPGNSVKLFRGQLLVKFNYDPKLVEAMRNVCADLGLMNSFDTVKKQWKIPVHGALVLANEIRGKAFDWDEKALEALTAAAHESQRDKDLDGLIEKEVQKLSDPLPNGMKLFEHQRYGVEYMLKTRRMILGDDMGLGKTLQALVATAILHRITGNRAIIVAPANLMHIWVNAATEIEHPGFKVISWNKVSSIKDEWINLGHRKFNLIADEAHYAQNTKAKRTKGFLELASMAEAVYALTGTPLKNAKPANLFPLLKALRLSIARTKSEFERRYCAGHMQSVRSGGGFIRIWDNKGTSNLKELHDHIKPVLLRRMKTECLDLPEKTRQIIPVELSDDEIRGFNKAVAEEQSSYMQRIKSGDVKPEGAALAALTAIRKYASIFKIKSTVDLAREITEAGHSVLVFTAFREAAIRIAGEFGVPCYIGGVPQSERNQFEKDFQAGIHKVFPATTKAGGTGLTLTKAQYVILHDRELTPGDNDQAEDRAHRIGQNGSVTVYWPQAFKIDETIDCMLQGKRRNIGIVLTGEDSKGEEIKITPAAILKKVFRNDG